MNWALNHDCLQSCVEYESGKTFDRKRQNFSVNGNLTLRGEDASIFGESIRSPISIDR